MAVKKEENTSANVMDVFFNGWWNQVDFIEEMEQKTLQTIKDQNEWLKGTRVQYTQMEDNSKKLTSEWKSNVQKLVEENNIPTYGANFPDLVNKLEEIGHRTQTIAFLPGKTSLDILSTSGDQLERTYTKAMGQQQKTRDEFSKAYEGVMEQFKQTQMGVFKLFEFNPSVLK
jgi:hypothetical protein